MNRLQLCQKLTMKAGIGAGDGSQPASTISQTGELARVVGWIDDAWSQIQTESNHWRWMRSRFSVNTVASTQAYAPTACTDTVSSAAITAARFRSWLLEDRYSPPWVYLTSDGVSGRRKLVWCPWEYFNYLYNITNMQSGPPVHISVDPQNNIVFGPTPDDIYTVGGEYQRGSQVMTADGDIPEMPAEYHMLIVSYAQKLYGLFEGAPEQISAGIEGIRLLKSSLNNSQLPVYRAGSPLV